MAVENTLYPNDGRQRFQWSSGGDIVDILIEYDPETEKNVVFLDDIQLAFPGAQYIRSGTLVVPYLRDKTRKFLEPKRILARDSELLQVVAVSERLTTTSYFSASTVQSDQAMSSTSESVQSISSLSPSTVVETPSAFGTTTTDAWLLNEIVQTLEEVRGDQQKNHAVTVDMLKTTHNWLALILDRANAIFQLTYELHEYPIPRLFVILPGRSSFKDRMNPLVDKYRLYFLCECDISVKSTTGSHTRPHVHFAKHDGYDLERPTEFFRKYGPYVLALLQLLRFSVAATSFIAPHIAGIGRGLEKGLEEVENAAKKQLTQKVDQAIEFLQELPSSEPLEIGDSDEADRVEALEGADLRHLASFLKNKDETRVLGNLYRLARPNGTVKWVCLDHYREEYKRTELKQFTEFVAANKGTYDANQGKVEIRLTSKMMATQFYEQLSKAKFIHELVVAVDWNASLDDFKDLRAAMESLPTILCLTVDCCNVQSRVRDLVSRGTPSRIIAKTMAGKGLQTFAIRNCQDFLSQVDKFPMSMQLRKIDLGTCVEGRALKETLSALVKRCPRLRHLIVHLPTLSALVQLFTNPKSYQFNGPSVLEVHVESGETISGTVEGSEFKEVTMRAMDCVKDFAVVPFVTKLFTKITPETNLGFLVDYFKTTKKLTEIDIEVNALLFFDIRTFLCQSSKDIKAVYLHDDENTLRMSDVQDPNTAEVDVLYDNVDFERLFSCFGAIPRYFGAHVAMTNETVDMLERRTRAESRLRGLWVDVSLLDGLGIDNVIAIVQRSSLQEFSIRRTKDMDLPRSIFSQDEQKSRRLIKAIAPFLKETHLHFRCRVPHIIRHYKMIRDLFTDDENCQQLSLGDGESYVVMDDVRNSQVADVSIATDDIGDVSLNHFYELFGSVPNVLGVNTEFTFDVIAPLEKAIRAGRHHRLKELTIRPSILTFWPMKRVLEIISQCRNLVVLTLLCPEEGVLELTSNDSLLSKIVHIPMETELRIHSNLNNFVQIYNFLMLTPFAEGNSRKVMLHDGPSFIAFEDVRKPLVNRAHFIRDFPDCEMAWELFGILPMELGFSLRITNKIASTVETLTRLSPGLYTDIRISTSALSDPVLMQDMATAITRLALSTFTVYCPEGCGTNTEKRDLFLRRVLPHLHLCKIFIYCRVKEFATVFELLQNAGLSHPPSMGTMDRPTMPRYLCDGDRYLTTTSTHPLEPQELELRGERGVLYKDDQNLFQRDDWDELGDSLQTLGSSLVHLDTESMLFLDKDAVHLHSSTKLKGSRLKVLRLSSEYLSKQGFESMQKVIDRSWTLEEFTFICGSVSGGYSGTSAAFEMLMRNRKKITELTLMGIETRPWIYQLHDHLPTRAYLPNLTSFQILSDGNSMNEELGHWIRYMTCGRSKFKSLTKIRLCNVHLPGETWERILRDLELTRVEELDFEGSDVTAMMMTNLLRRLTSKSLLKRLNLAGIEVSSRDQMSLTHMGRETCGVEITFVSAIVQPSPPSPLLSPQLDLVQPQNQYQYIPQMSATAAPEEHVSLDCSSFLSLSKQSSLRYGRQSPSYETLRVPATSLPLVPPGAPRMSFLVPTMGSPKLVPAHTDIQLLSSATSPTPTSTSTFVSPPPEPSSSFVTSIAVAPTVSPADATTQPFSPPPRVHLTMMEAESELALSSSLRSAMDRPLTTLISKRHRPSTTLISIRRGPQSLYPASRIPKNAAADQISPHDRYPPLPNKFWSPRSSST
ncbi:hypothetical protein BGZ83_004886 [Gryganskiella cystojenkinii]|nr:hypothetical protein BGZ83_004886 [Gryganskiella cystojenkinii]